MKTLFTIAALVFVSNVWTQENPFTGKSKQEEPLGYEIDSEEDIKIYQEELRKDSIRIAKQDSISNSQLKTTRQIIKRPKLDLVKAQEDCVITLIFDVDTAGNICSQPLAVREQTTTSDNELVQKVVTIVKNELKYSKGNTMESAKLTVRINGVGKSYGTVVAKNPKSQDLTDGKEYKIQYISTIRNKVYISNDKHQSKWYSLDNFYPL